MLSLHSKMFPNPNEPSNTFEMHDITSFYPFSPASLHLNDGLQELFAPTTASLPPAADIVVKESSRAAQPRSDRRRSTRKDRHSKIFTAQGPRDRRMRLSLDVARKFFDLQDLLGFDKPSKTVQWLLTKSKSPIKELLAASKSELSSSPCEEDISTVSSVLVNEKINAISKDKPFRSRRSLLQPKVGRESREKARARARERTLEKKMKQNTPNKRDNSQLDLKSSCLFAAEMDLKHCSASSMYGKQPHDYEGSNSMDMLDYNLQNVVSNTFHELWDQMSFTSNHIDERYFFS